MLYGAMCNGGGWTCGALTLMWETRVNVLFISISFCSHDLDLSPTKTILLVPSEIL